MTTAQTRSRQPPRLQGRKVIVAIGIFKILHGCLMILLAVAVLALTRQDVGDYMKAWADDLDVGPYRRHIGEFVGLHILRLSDTSLVSISVGAGLYATLFFTEGAGLIFDKIWAEWLVVISTGGLIPVELIEIYRKHHPLMALMFLCNLAIVIYLARRVHQRIAHHKQLASANETPQASSHQDAGSGGRDNS